MNRAIVDPNMIKWAVDRSGYDRQELERKFKKLPDWLCGNITPTYNQLYRFANAVHIPEGFLYLDSPLEESIPIPDFRTYEGDKFSRLSPNLLAVIDATTFRQDWYQKYAFSQYHPPVEIIRCANIFTDPIYFATQLRKVIKFSLKERENFPVSEDSLIYLINKLEGLGILVMVSGIVDCNTRRKLNLEEFSGLALCDKYAPLIFVNAADTKAGQIYTLIRELGHLILGAPGLSNVGIHSTEVLDETEIWCNKFASEFLISEAELKGQIQNGESVDSMVNRLAEIFRVSNLIVLRRLLDIDVISCDEFEYFRKLNKMKFKGSCKTGQIKNDNYSITIRRLSRKFATALISDTKSGGTLFRDGYEMLGNTNSKVFDRLAKELGVKNLGIVESVN